MSKPATPSVDPRYNRDDEQRIPSEEGRAPRPATEPEGSEESTRSDKIATDPVTGAPNRSRDQAGSS